MASLTRLRPRTARQIDAWPEEPVAYRRPLLRSLATSMLLAFVAFDLSMVWWPPVEDPLLASDWWLGPVIMVMLGFFYILTCGQVAVTADHVVVRNPFRLVRIPLGHVTSVEAGTNLRIETAYGRFYSWAVDAGNAQAAAGNYGTQGELGELISRASKFTAPVGRRARYRWERPDLLLIASIAVVLVNAAVLAAAGPTG